MARLQRTFFERPAAEVARGLLGKRLVRKTGPGIISGRIVETEAYIGEDDLASHARFGKTARNRIMYGRGGFVYIYLIYGIYYNLNIVAATEGVPEAVLIRSLEPVAGQKLAKANLEKFGRVRANRDLMKGPGKLCVALGLDKSFYGEDLISSKRIWVEDAGETPQIDASTRIGIDYAGHYRDKPWRFTVRGSKYVSK